MGAAVEVAELLAVRVSIAGERRPFGELDVAAVRTHAAALAEGSGLGHGNRVGAVSAAWKRLALTMDERAVATVAELDPATIVELAEPLWIVPPGGSLLP